MRDSRWWKAELAKELLRDWPDGAQRSAFRLLEVELVLHLAERVAPNHPAKDAWALLSGYPFLLTSQQSLLVDHATMLGAARHLVLWFKDQYDWHEALRNYQRFPEHVRGYEVDLALGTAQRRVPSALPDRFDEYEKILTHPPRDATSSITIATPGRYFNQAPRETSVTIPEWFPAATNDGGHDVAVRQDRTPLRIEWSDLVAAASWGDEQEKRIGIPEEKRSKWGERLERIKLKIRQADNSFSDSQTLTIDGIMHLIGMVGAGKSTLVEVLVLWCHLHRKRVCVIAENVTSVLRKTVHLQALGIKATPVLGQSNRVQHLIRVHRLTNPGDGRIAPSTNRMFDFVSTACWLDGLRDHAATPWDIRYSPCSGLVPEGDSSSGEAQNKRQVHSCPAWHSCPRHQASRDLVDADVWVATTASLIHTAVPQQLNAERLRYLELAWRRCDLIIVDEADQVQAQLDSVFSPEQQLIGEGDDAWLDEVIDRTKKTIRQAGRGPMRDPLVRRWQLNLNKANDAVDIIYSALSRDSDRPQPALSRRWLDKAYFTEWTLSQQLAQSWAGYGSVKPNTHQPQQGWEADPVYLRLRSAFDELIDDPLGTKDSNDPLTRDLVELTAHILRDADESVRLRRVREWLEQATKNPREENLQLTIDDLDRQAARLEFTLAVAVLAHCLNQAMNLFRAIEIVLGLEGVASALFHRAPRDYQPVVPESPMGNVLGFQYLEDEHGRRRGRAPMGRLRFFRCGGVGRWILLHLHELFFTDADRGPNVLLLSGTSWAGKSARYHIDVPVTGILSPPEQELDAISKSRFEFFPLFSGDHSSPIRVSGKFGEDRESALREMVAELADPGAGKSILEQRRDSLPEDRQRLLLLVGSYAEARMVAEHLVNLHSSWKDQILHLVADDEEFTDSWRGVRGLRRSEVATLASTSAWILVAPLLAVERGHNILNEANKAAIGAAYFLVRPHPRPDDLSYLIQRINQWAALQIHNGFPEVEEADRSSLGQCARAFRSTAHREWRRLLNLKLAYSNLPREERQALAWTQLVTIWQVIGRLVRGGVEAKVYFCDAAFAPHAAQRAQDSTDDDSLSLLIGMRDVLASYLNSACTDPDKYLVDTLYRCLYQALSRTEGL
ncbi:pPIWI_RE_Z domain-containing protein [Saccharopolyspora rectivirgula]|uniref:pPIWI_RE_Z domain-containing protein n=3 Tax=Saccharopolyspora rectivirgula TaxID=28042 RepID=UPI000A91D823|nr:transposase [Saccharopolyspora rectivirgula]